MAAKQLATLIDEDVKKALDAFCESRGLKLNRFIEDAILDKLEEHSDLAELKALRKEKSKPIEEVIKGLKKLGKL